MTEKTIRSVLNKPLRSEEFLASLVKLSESVEQKNGRTFEASSPAEAWAFLMRYVDLPGSITKDPWERPRAIYRGQSDASWGLSPGLLRLDKTEQQTARAATKHFADISQVEFTELWMADLMAPWPPLHTRSGEAAAQHFGMKTTLLDWSSLYSVAIDVATENADGKLAAVWWLYLSDAELVNLRLILPPPYVHRLYLQRGLFTDVVSDEIASVLEKHAYKVVFPATHHERTRVVADGKIGEIPTLLPLSPWFEALRDYCNSDKGRAAYAEATSDGERLARFDAYRTRLKNPPRKPWDYVIEDLGVSTWLGGRRGA